jgi:death-on-curing protein
VKRPVWVDAALALALHEESLTAHGGAPGIRDRSLLESALNRPLQHLAYGDRPDIIQLAALYTSAIIRNHPFIDGNKRTAFLVGVVFLELNGHRFGAAEEDATQAVLALATDTVTEAEYELFLRANSPRARKQPG